MFNSLTKAVSSLWPRTSLRNNVKSQWISTFLSHPHARRCSHVLRSTFLECLTIARNSSNRPAVAYVPAVSCLTSCWNGDWRQGCWLVTLGKVFLNACQRQCVEVELGIELVIGLQVNAFASETYVSAVDAQVVLGAVETCRVRYFCPGYASNCWSRFFI